MRVLYSTPPSTILLRPNNWYQSLLIDDTNQDPFEPKFENNLFSNYLIF